MANNVYNDLVGAVSSATLSASIELETQVHAILNNVPTLRGEILIAHSQDATPYTGSYEIVPHVYAQTLPTKSTYMLKDMLIKAIPYYETSNLSGKTVYIGEE